MTPIEAMVILQEYDKMPYKNKAATNVCYAARKLLGDEARRIMQRETGQMCTACWGDGFHRTSDSILSGACERCGGSGKIPPISDGERSNAVD